MSLYVVALTDRRLAATTILGRRYGSIRVGRVHAVVQRRARVPLRDEVELERQFSVVVELSARFEAILPVRFGTLMDRRDLDAAIRRHEAVILRALDEVRGCAQMTVRIVGRRRSAARPPAMSGREYLERKRRAAVISLPRIAVEFLARLERFVLTERRSRGSGRLLATVYHLVDASSVDSYLADARRHPDPGILVTGPFPPFAFAPEID